MWGKTPLSIFHCFFYMPILNNTNTEVNTNTGEYFEHLLTLRIFRGACPCSIQTHRSSRAPCQELNRPDIGRKLLSVQFESTFESHLIIVVPAELPTSTNKSRCKEGNPWKPEEIFNRILLVHCMYLMS